RIELGDKLPGVSAGRLCADGRCHRLGHVAGAHYSRHCVLRYCRSQSQRSSALEIPAVDPLLSGQDLGAEDDRKENRWDPKSSSPTGIIYIVKSLALVFECGFHAA